MICFLLPIKDGTEEQSGLKITDKRAGKIAEQIYANEWDKK
jgi:hypothetical protein